MKNLANCKPSEFLSQTNRMRKYVEKWLTETDILKIRKRLAPLEKVPEGATEEERRRIFDANKAATEAQAKKNLSEILDSILDAHAQETLVLLGLMCFIEPDDVDNYPVSDYLDAFAELIGNRSVLNFFTSLVQLGQTGILMQ